MIKWWYRGTKQIVQEKVNGFRCIRTRAKTCTVLDKLFVSLTRFVNKLALIIAIICR